MSVPIPARPLLPIVPPPSPRVWRSRIRSLAAVLLTVSGGMYALLGNEFFARLGHVFDRAGRRVGEAGEDIRTQIEAERLSQSRKTFEELLACRETLAGQVKALTEHRAAVAARHDQNVALLRKVLAIRDAKTAPPGDVSRDAVERDAANVLHRVRADEDELSKCDSELRRLAEALERLDHNVDQARIVVQQQADELDRRNAGATGGRAYRDGNDLADQIIKPSR